MRRLFSWLEKSMISIKDPQLQSQMSSPWLSNDVIITSRQFPDGNCVLL